MALLLKAYSDLREHTRDVPAQDWDCEPMKNWLAAKPPLLYSFLRCGEFFAPSGDKYVLTFTGDDTTPVSEVQTVFKLWLEANHKLAPLIISHHVTI